MATDLKGLNNFMRRLAKVKDLEKSRLDISSAVADKGIELATNAYSSTSRVNPQITKETSLDGDYAVVAQGEGLAFLEYGTGYYAEGTYKGKLPQTGVPITGEWDYYYDSEFKDEVDGKKGWWTGKSFQTGHDAGNQMYNASVDLRKSLEETVGDKVRELLK